MANVFDYLKWRDDIKMDKLNEIDILIFNRIVYFPWEMIMNSKEQLSFCEAYKRSLTIKNLKYSKLDMELLKCLASSNRYKDLIVSDVVSKSDYKKYEQFMAITIHLPKNYLYLAFRGTTNDLIGWKESLSMAYMTTFSQLDALNYLNKANITKKLYLGGHSKGGNLAMYAAIYTNRLIQSRIIKVFNFDGPGFMELNNKYYNINRKIVSYLPNSSIIGRLMKIDHQVVVVDSSEKGFKGHSLYSWQVEKDHLLSSSFSEDSNFIKKEIDNLMIKISLNDFEKIVNGIFDAIEKTGAKSIKEIDFIKLKDILLSSRNLSKENKEYLFNIFKIFYNSSKASLIKHN